MDLMLRKLPGGTLMAADDETVVRIARLPAGQALRGKFTKVRNYRFLAKFMVLMHMAFDMWAERVTPIEYKGIPVAPEFNRFRRDVVIMAGHYDATFNALGETRLEAKSISFDRMEEEEFEQVYSDVINALLQKVLPRVGISLTGEQMRDAVERVMEFA